MNRADPSSRLDPAYTPGRHDTAQARYPSVNGGRTASVPRQVFVALGWGLVAVGSVTSTVVALWITISIARAAQGPDELAAGRALWLWCLAVGATLGLPFALAVWKHHQDPRRLGLTLAWLPMAWNLFGLLAASQLVPDLTGSALRGYGAWVATRRFGDTHSSTRVLSALGHHTADTLAPASTPAAAVSPSRTEGLELGILTRVDRAKAMRVPFTEEGTAIVMEATLEGNAGRLALPYLFDTGASFTTISNETAHILGVDVPATAPRLVFNTANGPRESRMVYLPALELGEVRIENLLVSVCDGCVNNRHRGLLGHNVMREFFAQIDYKKQEMLLVPRVAEERPNRAYDIESITELKVEGAAELWLGRMRWTIAVVNRGPVPIYDIVPVVKFADGPTVTGRTIATISPEETGYSLVEGKATVTGGSRTTGQYTLGLSQAYW